MERLRFHLRGSRGLYGGTKRSHWRAWIRERRELIHMVSRASWKLPSKKVKMKASRK